MNPEIPKLRHRLAAPAIGFMLLPLVASAGTPSPPPAAFTLQSFARAPLYFEANRGQAAAPARFIARGSDCTVLIGATDSVLLLAEAPEQAATSADQRYDVTSKPAPTRAVRLTLEGANPEAAVSGREPLPARANYFLGDDRGSWRTGIPLFAAVQVQKPYPGVDLVYYCSRGGLEYDFQIEPGADPGQIALRVGGADVVRIDAEGGLVLKVGEGWIRQHKPRVYQVVNGERQPIAGDYVLRNGNIVGFKLGAYDRRLPLVIDPVLSYSTYLGGKLDDRGWGVAVDGDGNIFVAGETLSPDLRANVFSDAFLTNYQGGRSSFGDAFLAGFAPGAGTNLSFLTYFGGRRQDAAFAVAANTNVNGVFITGYTDSDNFPKLPTNAFQTQLGGTNLNAKRAYAIDAFVARFDRQGALVYSTLLGGNHRDTGLGIAADPAGFAYVTGFTEASNFPTVNALQGEYLRGREPGTLTNYSGAVFARNGDAFVTKVNLDGTGLVYSTLLGGSNLDVGQAIVLDSGDRACVVGATASTNFPVTSPLTSYLNTFTNRSSASDGFISVLSADGTRLLHSSYLGGTANDAAIAAAADRERTNFYVTGYAYSTNINPQFYFPPLTSTNFPTFASRNNANADVFVMKFAAVDSGGPDGYTLTNEYSVAFGGRKNEQGQGIAVDAAGAAYVVGFSASVTNLAGPAATNFFATNLFGLSITNSTIRSRGANDAFIAQLDSAGTNLLFSAYLGGDRNDQANGITLDPASGQLWIVGTTWSATFPHTTNAFQPARGGKKNRSDAFLGKIEFP